VKHFIFFLEYDKIGFRIKANERMVKILKKIILGISPRLSVSDNHEFYRCRKDYIDAFEKRGVACIFLTLAGLETTLPLCDGLVILGGDDYDPRYYHETNQLEESKDIDLRLDEADRMILCYAMQNKIPLLGICRGHQAINALLGYPLCQDITYHHVSHPCSEHLHSVKKIASMPLSRKLPDSFTVNSYHHQACCMTPPDFTATFKNGDVIEAMEHNFLPIITFQWHPERLQETKESNIIFDYFLSLVKGDQNGR
jgi:putative glutamine amidotransferase